MAGPNLIDWTRVNELRNEVGATDFDEVVVLFLEEVDEVVERLRSTPNVAQYEADLHFMKSSSLSLGFVAFSALCQAGERMAAEGAGAEVNVGEILATYDVSRAQFLEDRNTKLVAA